MGVTLGEYVRLCLNITNPHFPCAFFIPRQRCEAAAETGAFYPSAI